MLAPDLGRTWRGVLAPRPGDEKVRLELTDGRHLGLPGVPPQAAPALRALWTDAR